MSERQEQEKPLVLLVDDVPANLHVLAAALKHDYRIKTATSGEGALELAARDDKPDLILLDVMMPGLSGIEVLRRLRRNPETSEIPVIFITADLSEQSQLDGLELGAEDYLTKPVVLPVLQVRVRNLLQRKRTERQLRLAAHVFEHSGEAIMVTDRYNRIVDVNPAFTRLTGYAQHEVQGRDPRVLASGRTAREVYAEMWRRIQEEGFWQGEIWDRHKNGEVYPKLLTVSVVRTRRGAIDFHIASYADLSQQKAIEERIRHVAYHDPLTGLPNRLYLQIGLEQVIATARREAHEIAVMFLDLDRFKDINDTLGHHVGDCLLVEVARRLRLCVRECDQVARLGGDEFVVVLTGANAAGAAVPVAEKLIAGIAQPFQVEGHLLHTTPSIGISVWPQDGDSIEDLMKGADTAMYHAKDMGRSQFRFYTESMNGRSREKLEMENSLHEALERQEFVLFYQPQAEAAGGRLVGAEALLRWRHPVRGLLAPEQFLPLAEETGMILPIGEWVLRQVCRQIRAWEAAGLPRLVYSVNLSARQFHQEKLAERIRRIVEETGVDPSVIELEITESTAMQQAGDSVEVLKQLHAMGFSLAIDDFGAGYSSLGYLKRFSVNKLKIDRSFVRDIPGDANSAAIADAVIHMARSLELAAVAEGVETREQCEFLRDRGCPLIQGYWYGRPMDAEAFAAFARQAGGRPVDPCGGPSRS